MRRFREISLDEELEKIPPDLASWGYYRELVEHELGYSHWVRYGQDLIFWLTRIKLSQHATFHICSRPEVRSRISRRVITGSEVIAELLGFERLFALKPSTIVGGYLLRLGWCRYDLGFTKLLGDE